MVFCLEEEADGCKVFVIPRAGISDEQTDALKEAAGGYPLGDLDEEGSDPTGIFHKLDECIGGKTPDGWRVAKPHHGKIQKSGEISVLSYFIYMYG